MNPGPSASKSSPAPHSPTPTSAGTASRRSRTRGDNATADSAAATKSWARVAAPAAPGGNPSARTPATPRANTPHLLTETRQPDPPEQPRPPQRPPPQRLRSHRLPGSASSRASDEGRDRRRLPGERAADRRAVSRARPGVAQQPDQGQ